MLPVAKKTLILFSSIILSLSAYSQSFEVGARYFAMSNWFLNGNVSNAGSSQGYVSAYSYSYGFDFAYNFNERISIETNILFATLKQNYTGQFSSAGYAPEAGIYAQNESYTSTTTVNVTQIPLFFRFLSGNGAYMELGPELDLINDANYSATYSGGPNMITGGDVAGYYANAYASVVLAFGNNIRLHNSLYFNINLRFAYDFIDMKGVDALGQNINGLPLYSGSDPYYSSYKATHSMSAAFAVGLMYRFGHDF